MKVRWEPWLMEELVKIEAKGNRNFGDICQQRLEKAYELSEEQRSETFATIYSTLFEEHQLGEPFNRVLAKFPLLLGLAEVLIFRTISSREEGAELRRDQTKMGVRLRAERLHHSEQLIPFLYHEFMHISDMLDPSFGYRDEPLDQVQEHLVPQRYQVLWDCYIDGRLERLGKEEMVNKEERQRQFERLFSLLPRRQRLAAFQELWQTQSMTHAQLMELSKEPAKLSRFGADIGEISARPTPGTFCPLCQFPTFVWADPEPKILPFVQRDLPTWTREEGICGQCYEYYLLRYAKEGVTP